MTNNLRKIVQLYVPCCLIITWLFLLNYNDFFSKDNISAFLGIAAMIFLIIGYFSNKNK